MSKKRLFVVDAMALAFRSFHAILRPLSNPDGMPTQALYGSLMFLMKLIEEERPDYNKRKKKCRNDKKNKKVCR